MKHIRLVNPKDSDKILAIYEPYVSKTPFTFETEVPSKEDFLARVVKISSRFPYLVYIDNNEIVGYSYANEFRERKAYRFMVESTVYIKEGYTGKGAGKTLYERLFLILERLGYLKVYAGIGTPNENSVIFHKAMGFKETCCFKNAGFKLGSWHDCLYLEKELVKEYYNILNPPEPVSISTLSDKKILDVLKL